MLSKISYKLASSHLIFWMILLLLFHFFVLIGVIPYDFIWGGRINSHSEMVQMEIISLVVILVFLLIMIVRINIYRIKRFKLPVRILSWIVTLYFGFNAITNFLSTSGLEQAIFLPLSILLFLLGLKVSLDKSDLTDDNLSKGSNRD